MQSDETSENVPAELPNSSESLRSILDEAKQLIQSLKKRCLINERIMLCFQELAAGGVTKQRHEALCNSLETLVDQAASLLCESSASLLLYLPPAVLSEDGKVRKRAADTAASVRSATSRNGRDRVRELADATALLLSLDKEMILALDELVMSIYHKLDAVSVTSRPEENTENLSRPKKLPRNPNVLKLANRVKQAIAKGIKPNILELARELVDEDAEAQNICRQLRDRPDLLE